MFEPSGSGWGNAGDVFDRGGVDLAEGLGGFRDGLGSCFGWGRWMGPQCEMRSLSWRGQAAVRLFGVGLEGVVPGVLKAWLSTRVQKLCSYRGLATYHQNPTLRGVPEGGSCVVCVRLFRWR